tara:strand:+ start:12534 stop:13325 length:792 start_codon:yes stop_codon:yes gene_type:complete
MNNNLTPAATVLVLKNSKTDIEVLMVKRSKRPPFENLYVFPGGKIDDDDYIEELELYTDGLNDIKASQILGLKRGGLGFWIACIRECFEEVGILFAKRKSGESLDFLGDEKISFDKYRKMLINNKINMMDICKREDLILSTLNIAPLSHWITPNIETRRFDTRFFIAFLPENQIESHDGNELTQSLWINPTQAIDRAFKGEMQMIMPTIKNLQSCEGHKSAEDFLSHQKSLTKEDFPPILPKFFKKNGNWVGLLPGDKGYEDH